MFNYEKTKEKINRLNEVNISRKNLEEQIDKLKMELNEKTNNGNMHRGVPQSDG